MNINDGNTFKTTLNTEPEERDNASSRESLQARLQAARESQEATRRARDKLEAEYELEREVEEAERDAEDQRALLELEAEHGKHRIATVSTSMGLVVLKRSNPLRYKRFQDLGNPKTADAERLVRPCVVHPSTKRFDEICEELPATTVVCGNVVAELAGVRNQENAGK